MLYRWPTGPEGGGRIKKACFALLVLNEPRGALLSSTEVVRPNFDDWACMYVPPASQLCLSLFACQGLSLSTSEILHSLDSHLKLFGPWSPTAQHGHKKFAALTVVKRQMSMHITIPVQSFSRCFAAPLLGSQASEHRCAKWPAPCGQIRKRTLFRQKRILTPSAFSWVENWLKQDTFFRQQRILTPKCAFLGRTPCCQGEDGLLSRAPSWPSGFKGSCARRC